MVCGVVCGVVRPVALPVGLGCVVAHKLNVFFFFSRKEQLPYRDDALDLLSIACTAST